MAIIIEILIAVGSAIWWVVKTFFPYLIKRFGIGTVKFFIQKSISAILILMTGVFFFAVLAFISKTYTIFKNFTMLLNNPAHSALATSSPRGVEIINCFMNLLHASGIATGLNAAFAFGISVLIFIFLYALYTTSLRVVKLISDEVSKSLRLV